MTTIEQKIKKLKAMIEDGATTINEKEVASKLLEKLVTQYCIDIDKLNGTLESNNIGSKYSYLRFVKDPSPNVHKMITELGKTFSCHVFLSRSVTPDGNYCFVISGRPEMREQVDYLFTYLFRIMKGLFKLSVFDKDRSRLENGFCDGVIYKLQELRDHNEKYYGQQSQALMKINNEYSLARDFARSQYSLVGSNYRLGESDKYGLGYNAGKNVAMNKGIRQGGITKGLLK